ncbi:hypothetical protein NPIL_461231 [Nephila pilipes]|uniref:Uncharacterized protein n=1 Tax=Nephila pilipes TaxID=299642 RepID=A0A8X6NU97_NEPPI|nr:hypothetical protein NPIL_461231 [Nephila pilipes]
MTIEAEHLNFDQVFFGVHGIVHREFVSSGQNINQQHFGSIKNVFGRMCGEYALSSVDQVIGIFHHDLFHIRLWEPLFWMSSNAIQVHLKALFIYAQKWNAVYEAQQLVYKNFNRYSIPLCAQLLIIQGETVASGASVQHAERVGGYDQ